MQMELDEIIYNAIVADQTLVSECSCIKSTCIEVPPTDEDNTPLPYIIVAEEVSQMEIITKDDMWEGDTDRVNVGVIISAASPNEVKRLRRLVRKAVSSYVIALGNDEPTLQSLSYDGIAWDWTNPCYYDTLHYSCDVEINLDEDNNDEQD